MSKLSAADRRALEDFLRMSGGYVLDFSDRTFGAFVLEHVGFDIHEPKYCVEGTSKAKKLRTFWKIEPDHVVGGLLEALISYKASTEVAEDGTGKALREKCRSIVSKLLTGNPSLGPLKEQAEALNANYMAEQIRRMEASVASDPSLAIGTAKELVETCCKTILAERGKPVLGTPDISTLTKETLKELKLVPDSIPDSSKGAEVLKRLLSNLGSIGNALAEIRGLYGTGHGKHGKSEGLTRRHARLAVGAAATLTVFLFETHHETL